MNMPPANLPTMEICGCAKLKVIRPSMIIKHAIKKPRFGALFMTCPIPGNSMAMSNTHLGLTGCCNALLFVVVVVDDDDDGIVPGNPPPVDDGKLLLGELLCTAI